MVLYVGKYDTFSMSQWNSVSMRTYHVYYYYTNTSDRTQNKCEYTEKFVPSSSAEHSAVKSIERHEIETAICDEKIRKFLLCCKLYIEKASFSSTKSANIPLCLCVCQQRIHGNWDCGQWTAHKTHNFRAKFIRHTKTRYIQIKTIRHIFSIRTNDSRLKFCFHQHIASDDD